MRWLSFRYGEDAIGHADHFLSVIGDNQNILLALDFEQNPDGSSMDLAQAGAFLTQVQARTARFPGIYGGGYLKKIVGGGFDTILAPNWLLVLGNWAEAFISPNWPALEPGANNPR